MSIPDDVYSETIQDISTKQSETITVDQTPLTNIQIAKLKDLGFLIFERVLTKQDGVEIYGSVNVNDIVQLLEKQHGIKILKSMLSGIPESANNKGSSLPLKSIGTHHIHVVARDINPIELVIIVKEKQ
jgi:ribosomal protein L9